MRNLLAISMIALALGLVACGDDNDDSSAEQGAAAGSTTTGTATTEDDGKSKTRADSKRKSSSGEAKSKSSSGSGSSERKSSSNGGSKTTNSGKGTPTTSNPNKNAGRSEELYTKEEAERLSSQLVAKRVCQGYLPDQTAKDLKRGKTTKQKVARAYAAGWPAPQKDEAYRGCLQGLNARDRN